jgi:stage III sporulation protein AD
MMVKIGLIGLAAVFVALPLRREKGEFSLLVILAAGLLIFIYVLARMQEITDFMTELADELPIEKAYLTSLLKMLGIAYVADYVSTICREAGAPSIGSQVELFAKLSIVALGIVPLKYLLEVIEGFL